MLNKWVNNTLPKWILLVTTLTLLCWGVLYYIILVTTAPFWLETGLLAMLAAPVWLLVDGAASNSTSSPAAASWLICRDQLWIREEVFTVPYHLLMPFSSALITHATKTINASCNTVTIINTAWHVTLRAQQIASWWRVLLMTRNQTEQCLVLAYSLVN